jgi:hypothetical protein
LSREKEASCFGGSFFFSALAPEGWGEGTKVGILAFRVRSFKGEQLPAVDGPR